ncbi:MAG TPA: ArsR family transcriptional regulator [Nevskiaceae bacterium]|nr:ArsR family transcriptional regulator [Nevskiaceae bacterium]
MNLDLALKALDNVHRRAVLTAMRDPQRNFDPIGGTDPLIDGVCVAQVSDFLGINQSTASAYMALLRDAGLVAARRVGKYTRYKRDEVALAALAAAIVRQL